MRRPAASSPPLVEAARGSSVGTAEMKIVSSPLPIEVTAAAASLAMAVAVARAVKAEKEEGAFEASAAVGWLARVVGPQHDNICLQYLHNDSDFKKDWMKFYTGTVDWFGTEKEQITAAVNISNDCCTFSLEQLMMTMHSDLLSNCQSYLCFQV